MISEDKKKKYDKHKSIYTKGLEELDTHLAKKEELENQLLQVEINIEEVNQRIESSRDYVELFDEVGTIQAIPKTEDYLFALNRKLKRGGTVKAYMRVKNGKYVVLKGSQVALIAGSSAAKGSTDRRKSMHSLIDHKACLKEDISFDSISGASSFVLYQKSNGNVDWAEAESGMPYYEFIKGKAFPQS